MLLRDDLLFLDALSAVSRGNNDTFKDVVKLLDGFGQLVRLMSNGNEREVATTQDNSTLFRGFFFFQFLSLIFLLLLLLLLFIYLFTYLFILTF